MKTVLEELEEDIYKLKESKCYINPNNFARDVIDLINYYKEKEKKQIIDAFDAANSEIHNEDGSFKTGEQYYNETFNK